MNKADTAKLLFIVKANYSKHYKDMSEEEFKNTVTAWHLCLSDYDYNLAQAGLKVFLTSDTKGFPPVVGQIIDGIHRIMRYESDSLTELDAWGLVYKAVCNSYYNSESEFCKLPDIVQRAVGNPARLKEWSQLDIKDIQTIIQSNFMRSFRAVQENERVYRKMPQDVRLMLPQDNLEMALEVSEKEKESQKEDIRGISEPEFIDNKMEQFYKIIGVNRN